MTKKRISFLGVAILVFSLAVNPVMASAMPADVPVETTEELPDLWNEEPIGELAEDIQKEVMEESPIAVMSLESIELMSVDNTEMQSLSTTETQPLATTETYHYEYSYTTPNNMVVLSPSNVNTTMAVEKAYPIIFANEGGYTTINPNDNGAVSIGRIQWHANRALSLLRVIISDSGDVASARYYLGDALYNEITSSSTSWVSRKFTSDETVKVKAFLQNTAVTVAVQDKMALSDITSYINHGITMGIRNVPALIYFADLENQGGASRSAEMANLAVNSNLCANKNSLTLNELYLAAVSHDVMGKKVYLYRRANVYKACVELGYPYCQSWDRLMPCVLDSYKTETFVGEAWLQWALNAYGGASLEITDKYDDATKNAIKLFQEMNGLSVDGQAGRDTIKLLATMIVNSKTYAADAYVPFLKILTTKDAWTVAANASSFSVGAKCSIAKATLTYASSNPAVATVSADGVVTPVAAGTTTITIQAQGYNLSKNVTVAVTNAVEGGAAPTVSSATYKVAGDKITGITTVPTSAAAMASNLKVENGTVKICDVNGNEITGNVGTGSKVQVYDANGNLNFAYTIIIYGDTNGDGNIWATDYTLIKNQIMTGKTLLSGPYSMAADVNHDGNIYATDYTAIKNYIMKGTKINQN